MILPHLSPSRKQQRSFHRFSEAQLNALPCNHVATEFAYPQTALVSYKDRTLTTVSTIKMSTKGKEEEVLKSGENDIPFFINLCNYLAWH